MKESEKIAPKSVTDLAKSKELKNPKNAAKILNLESGIDNTVLNEPVNEVEFFKSASEEIIKGKHNTFIVLGRDRPGAIDGGSTDEEKKVGYGARGHVKAGAIDIVVGRWSNVDATTFKGVPQNPNFFTDAARIYLSQKADIDVYFKLPRGASPPESSIARSAIGIKADDVRIMSRNTFKIVTGVDPFVRNGQANDSKYGLQIIAVDSADPDTSYGSNPLNILTTYKSLQPMVKGENLVGALAKILEDIRLLNSIVSEFMNIQKKFNQAVATHTHLSPFFGQPTSPSVELVPKGISMALEMFVKTEQSLRSHVAEITGTDTKFLKETSDTYINSKYHSLN
jgi:hypothetical protein